jgi:hypothetical protein
MSAVPVPIRRAASAPCQKIHGVVVGTVVGANLAGAVLVEFTGAPGAPVVARVATHDPEFAAAARLLGRKVVLVFEGGAPSRPLILGLIRDAPAESLAEKPAAIDADSIGAPGQPLTVNGRRLLLEGQQEIVLRCGQGSITLRADGSIVVKGTRLLSRASEVNKIRGASVQIN